MPGCRYSSSQANSAYLAPGQVRPQVTGVQRHVITVHLPNPCRVKGTLDYGRALPLMSQAVERRPGVCVDGPDEHALAPNEKAAISGGFGKDSVKLSYLRGGFANGS